MNMPEDKIYKCLVVDDEPDIAALVAYHLARDRYRVRTVGDGLEALQAVEAERLVQELSINGRML